MSKVLNVDTTTMASLLEHCPCLTTTTTTTTISPLPLSGLFIRNNTVPRNFENILSGEAAKRAVMYYVLVVCGVTVLLLGAIVLGKMLTENRGPCQLRKRSRKGSKISKDVTETRNYKISYDQVNKYDSSDIQVSLSSKIHFMFQNLIST